MQAMGNVKNNNHVYDKLTYITIVDTELNTFVNVSTYI
jgi:hypothetical protein